MQAAWLQTGARSWGRGVPAFCTPQSAVTAVTPLPLPRGPVSMEDTVSGTPCPRGLNLSQDGPARKGTFHLQ